MHNTRATAGCNGQAIVDQRSFFTFTSNAAIGRRAATRRAFCGLSDEGQPPVSWLPVMFWEWQSPKALSHQSAHLGYQNPPSPGRVQCALPKRVIGSLDRRLLLRATKQGHALSSLNWSSVLGGNRYTQILDRCNQVRGIRHDCRCPRLAHS